MHRIVKGAPATLRHTTLDEHDQPATAGAVTIGVVDATGAEVVAPGTATTEDADGEYSYSLAAQTTLRTLTATWAASGGRTWTTTHDVVAGRYFTILQGHDAHDELDPGGDFDDADIVRVRDVVESDFDRITGLAFARRYSRVVVSGSGWTGLQLPVRHIRAVRSVRLYDATLTTFTTLSAPQLAAITRDDVDPPGSCNGILTRLDGTWPEGVQNVVLEVEHGYDTTPPDVREAALRWLWHRLHNRNTEVLDRATQFNAAGGTFQLAQAGQYATGVPDIDAVLNRYNRKGAASSTGGGGAAGGGARPVSQPLRLSTNRRSSIFHR